MKKARRIAILSSLSAIHQRRLLAIHAVVGIARNARRASLTEHTADVLLGIFDWYPHTDAISFGKTHHGWNKRHFHCFLISCCASGVEPCGGCFSSAAASGCWNDSIPFDSRPVQQKQPTPLPRAIQGACGNLSTFQCLLFLSRGRLVA